ncbi:MAG: hypothetical protein QHH09_00965 [Microgenomates group bacterium]|nr:hypothetical protein [Microgenomates group bacterium]
MKPRLLSILLYIFASVWLVFAIFWFFRDSSYRYLYSTAGTMYALIMFCSAYFINKKKLWAWWLATILVGMNIIAGFCDQIGLIDLAFIAGTFVLFIILLKSRPRINH